MPIDLIQNSNLLETCIETEHTTEFRLCWKGVQLFLKRAQYIFPSDFPDIQTPITINREKYVKDDIKL